MNTKSLRTLSALILLNVSLQAADWPQFRGPRRDGRSPETGLLKTWPAGGPRLLWTAEGLGEGWSSAAVAGDRVYVTGMADKQEFVVALGVDGRRLWKQVYGKPWRKSFPGARSTPTVVGTRLYAISGAGEVVCLRAADGKVLWSVPARDRFGGKPGNWGTAESPLVREGKVFYTPCGKETTLVALDAMTGATVWTSPSLDDQSAYVSAIWIDHPAGPQVVTVTGAYVLGVDPANGAIRWRYAYADEHPTTARNRLMINAVSPVYREGALFVTSGYDHVGIRLDLAPDGNGVSLAWVSEKLDCHHGGVVLVDGFIYGAGWDSNSSGKWYCLDWKTGQVRYETSWNDNKGPVIYADGMLYCGDEDDFHLGLVRASPEGFTPVGLIEELPGKGKFWAHPSLADGRLYLRHGEFLRAYDIAAR